MVGRTVGRSDTAPGAFYRRLSSRIGKQKAVTATARKIAVLFYNALRHGMIYKDQGADAYDERHRRRVLSNPRRRAKTLGFALAPVEKGVAVSQEGRGRHCRSDRWRANGLLFGGASRSSSGSSMSIAAHGPSPSCAT